MPVNELTPLVLLNTLYFKDVWEEDLDFEKSIDFLNDDKTTSKISLLEGYAEQGLPYVGNEFSTFYATMKNGNKIHFILPNDGYELKDVMREEVINEVLNIKDYQFVTEGHANSTISYFPEFKLEYTTMLNDALSEYFGIKEIFDPETACLSNILNKGPSLFVQFVAHAASLEVSKKGVEGAAVTSVITAPTASAPSSEPFEFIIDRAFGVVVENRYGTVLFTGAVRDL